eukprot:scaffold5018_cov147-Skeletonema_menzelii.AAC.1
MIDNSGGQHTHTHSVASTASALMPRRICPQIAYALSRNDRQFRRTTHTHTQCGLDRKRYLWISRRRHFFEQAATMMGSKTAAVTYKHTTTTFRTLLMQRSSIYVAQLVAAQSNYCRAPV